AFYQRAELHRVLGEFDAAEHAYRQANELGREPQPGLARLRLAQGRAESADAAIRRVLAEADDPITRARLLGPYVEIAPETGEVAAAREATNELASIAAELDAPYLSAIAERAMGAVLLAEGDAEAALGSLRAAWSRWRGLDAPYEAARVRVLIGVACRSLCDDERAEMECDAGRSVVWRPGTAAQAARVRQPVWD